MGLNLSTTKETNQTKMVFQLVPAVALKMLGFEEGRVKIHAEDFPRRKADPLPSVARDDSLYESLYIYPGNQDCGTTQHNPVEKVMWDAVD